MNLAEVSAEFNSKCTSYCHQERNESESKDLRLIFRSLLEAMGRVCLSVDNCLG
jgi:hypothetical protein